MSHDLQDLNFSTGIEPRPPEVEVQSSNHWTDKEFPKTVLRHVNNSVINFKCHKISVGDLG